MRAVLGIDAAWTAHNGSGVALIVEDGTTWRLVAAAPDFSRFHRACGGPEHGGAEAEALLQSVKARIGSLPEIVAVDMPLANGPISGRRVSDNLISSAYGGRGAGTHSPSAVRPGAISEAMVEGFGAAGYALGVSQPVGRAIVEVYPHPALIELCGSARRLPYKISRVRQYWPEAGREERRERLLAQWRFILAHLGEEISGLKALALPDVDATVSRLKAFEDMLDAVICCWVGAMVLLGKARCFGDAFSAVWVPLPWDVHCTQAVGETG